MGCANTKEQLASKRMENTMVIGSQLSTKGSTHIDDEENLKKRGQFTKISAIRVTYSNEAVQSLQLAYELDCGTIVSGGSHSKKIINKLCKIQESQGIQQEARSAVNLSKKSSLNNKDTDSHQNNSIRDEVFEILEDDYLQEISGRIGENIEQVTFKTYRGHSSSFGSSKKGKIFFLKLANETFGPLASNDTLNGLRFPIIPVPESFNLHPLPPPVQKKQLKRNKSN